MADQKRVKDRLPAAATARAAEEREATTIVVTNTYRNQPVIFHFLGGSVRLGPLESQQIDRACLASPELSHLVLGGTITVSEPEPSDMTRGEGPRGDTPAGHAGRGSSPSSDSREE